MLELRARKSSAEVERIREAVAITDAAYQVLFEEVKPGMSERELCRLLAVEHLRRGAEMPGSITLAPYVPDDIRVANSTLRRPIDRVLTAGEMITQDAGGVYRATGQTIRGCLRWGGLVLHIKTPIASSTIVCRRR